MLDQNTDRMWYVIGAVIVGAAIIFLVNSSFPQLFASVTGVFEDKVEETSETITDIGRVGDNLIKDSDTFGAGMNVTAGGGSHFESFTSENPRQNASKIGNHNDSFGYFRYSSTGWSNPSANIYINNVFLEPNADYTFTFIGDRYGYGPIDYEIYFGDTLVETVDIGHTMREYVATGTSPSNLSSANYIKIRTTYKGSTGANAFWIYHPKLETGLTATPYVK